MARTWHWWALAALVLVFFSDPLFTGRVFFYRDLGMLMHPVLQAARADGTLVPFWTHLLSSGRPLLANPGYALLAPLDVVYTIFPFHLAFNAFLAAHVLVGAAGMAFLARRLGCSRVAAFSAGAAYGLGGGMISAIALYWTAVSAAWAPWVLAAGHAACGKPTRRRVALLALALGVQALGGQPEPILATLLVGGFMSLAAASGSALRRAGIVAATWGIAGAWGIMIAAPQLVPAALHARTTYRSLGFDAGQILYNSLDPRALPGLFLPRWGGSPMDALAGGFPGAAWTDTGTPYLLSHYLGLSIVALALVGAWHLARRKGMSGPARALALAAIAGVVIALGRHVPGATALMDALPFKMPLRYPVKALYATFLAIPPLAAIGLDALIASRIARWAPLLAAVVALDFTVAHRGFAPTASREVFEEPPLSLELKARAREIGILDGQWRIHHQRLPGGEWSTTSGEVERTEEAHYEWRRRMLIPPTGAAFGIHHAMERSGDLLDDLEYFELTRKAYASPPPEWATTLGEEAVLFVISPFADLETTTEGVLTHVEALDARQGLPAGSGHLYFNGAFRPRVDVVPRFADASSDGEVTSLDEHDDGLTVRFATRGDVIVRISDVLSDRRSLPGIESGAERVFASGSWSGGVVGDELPSMPIRGGRVEIVTAGPEREAVLRLRYRPRGLVAGGVACLVGLLGVVACRVSGLRALKPS